MRDGILAIDGTLDLNHGWHAADRLRHRWRNSAGRLSLNPEKLTRRTVYLPLRRANLPSLLNLFDFGDAVTVNGKRMLTNVAPQALFMMNSVFVDERAKNIVQSVINEQGLTDAKRVESLYLRILNRMPASEEVDSSLTYIVNFRQKLKGDKPTSAPGKASPAS